MALPFKGDLSESLSSQDHQLGTLPAPVRIVIYMDVCKPAFVTTHAQVKEIMSTFGESVVVAYRYLPDIKQNPLAFAVAQALEASAQQDGFWMMLEQLITHQDQLSDGFLRQYASAIQLDKAKFEDDFSSKATLKRIEHDSETAKSSGITNTPAIFINGVRQQTLSMRFIQELTQTGGNVMG